MADPRLMDRLFQRIMRGLIDSGVAPHYAELGRALGLSVEEGRQVLLRGATLVQPCVVKLRTRQRRTLVRTTLVPNAVEVRPQGRSEDMSMNPNKALWEKGDFTRIAESMRESGDALVQGSGSPRD